MKQTSIAIKKALTAGAFLTLGGLAWADPPFQGTPDPRLPLGPLLPTPKQVPGKEYVTQPNNVNYSHVVAPGQILAWDGLGGIQDSILVSGGLNLDALANHSDVLYREVIENRAHLLISVTGDQPAGPGFVPGSNRNHVWYELTSGARGVWATTTDINHNLSDAQSLTDGTFDLGGLEVWGPDGIDDTDRVSFVGDPGGVSVYQLGGGGAASAWITQAQIAAAIGLPSTDPVDVDALMVNDNGNGVWDTGDSILFSVMPIGPYDGGEVWVWDNGNNVQFLNHGGHLWDTAFDVRSAFNVDNENIDALEAVAIPEPAGLGVSAVLLGGLVAFVRSRRRAQKQ